MEGVVGLHDGGFRGGRYTRWFSIHEVMLYQCILSAGPNTLRRALLYILAYPPTSAPLASTCSACCGINNATPETHVQACVFSPACTLHGPDTLRPLLNINARFTMASIVISFQVPLVWEPISHGEKRPICIKARKSIRAEHCNEEPYTFTSQRPIMYGCMDVGVDKEPKD